ncbi:hypothetical protein R3P38DRAFT_3199951 [Favolaschia claudopus]|uniref:F-box domain-containing protein n=1 Tax=Favolaschia claudopus TaxID=2862362 RepID=A0AAW0AYX3_9AGAR
MTDLFSLLPVELVSAIFHLALTDVKSAVDVYNNDLLRLRLCWTNRFFKRILYDSPVFWTFISMEYPQPRRPYRIPLSNKLLTRHIRKSRSRPLHVAFDLPILAHGQDNYTRAWRKLVAVSGRWVSLFLKGGNVCAIDKCVAALLCQDALRGAIHLQRVRIDKHRGEYPTCWIMHPPTRLCSPHFQTVDCLIPSVLSFTPSLDLQHLDVTTGATAEPPSFNWSTFFSSCPNLKSMCWERTSDVVMSAPVTLLWLDKLTLKTASPFPPIHGPNLTFVEVSDGLVPLPMQAVNMIIGPAAPRLTTLWLAPNPTTNLTLVQFVERCPQLRSFTASVSEIRTAVYRSLATRVLFQIRTNDKRIEDIAFGGPPPWTISGAIARDAYSTHS